MSLLRNQRALENRFLVTKTDRKLNQLKKYVINGFFLVRANLKAPGIRHKLNVNAARTFLRDDNLSFVFLSENDVNKLTIASAARILTSDLGAELPRPS